MKLLSGIEARKALVPKLIEKVRALSYVPTLAIIQVGDRADSNAYIKGKMAFAKKIGVDVKLIRLPEAISQEDLITQVRQCNSDKDIQGVIVQLPLPDGLDKKVIINAIDIGKDVDVLSSSSVQDPSRGPARILPATARGVRELLSYYGVLLSGKKVTVVGRSALVGSPIASMCTEEGATVTVCHSQTSAAEFIPSCKNADILIVAAGKAQLIGKDHVKPGQVVIDVGINTVEGEKLEDEIAERKITGDVDFEIVKDIVEAISPVPGGVGPMTVLALFENLIELCQN